MPVLVTILADVNVLAIYVLTVSAFLPGGDLDRGGGCGAPTYPPHLLKSTPTPDVALL